MPRACLAVNHAQRSTMLHAANFLIAANVAAQYSYAGFSFLTSLAAGAVMLAAGWVTLAYGARA